MYATRDQFDEAIVRNVQYWRVKRFLGSGRWDQEETKNFWIACEIAKLFGNRSMVYAINRVSGALVVTWTEALGFQPLIFRGAENPMSKFFVDGQMIAQIRDRSDDEFDLKSLSGSTLVSLYNKYSGKEPLAKFSSKEEGVRRLTEVLKAVVPGEEAPTTEATEEVTVAKKTKKTTNGGGKRMKYDRDAKIEILVDANPIRESAKTHARFAGYRNGMKLGTALEKIEGLTMADVKYHITQKWIKLVSA